jgi:hypothetical protein
MKAQGPLRNFSGTIAGGSTMVSATWYNDRVGRLLLLQGLPRHHEVRHKMGPTSAESRPALPDMATIFFMVRLTPDGKPMLQIPLSYLPVCHPGVVVPHMA